MRLLVDTHAFIWLVEGDSRLSANAQTALLNTANDLFLSVASVWELAIKIGTSKLTLSDPLDVFVTKWTIAYQLDLLPVQSSHAFAVVGLATPHRDPFDRMLIAQAGVEGMTLVSSDKVFASYAVPVLW